MILLPPANVTDLDAYRRKRGERTRETTPQPVVAPVDPRAFCVAAIRRELADIDEGTAALNAAIDAAAMRPRVSRDLPPAA